MKQTLVQYLMVAMLVIGAYFIGVYKTENTYLKQSGALTAQIEDTQIDYPEEKKELTSEEWTSVQGKEVGSVGKQDANIVMVEWTDYQCPFCSNYVRDTFGKIKENYIDTGKIRYEVRDLILPFHPNAKPAAIAARCAAKEGKFWEMHDKLFAEQTIWSALSDASPKFAEYATAMGIGQAKWDSCVSDSSVASAVDADTNEAARLGASGTPTFMINGKLLVGAQPYQVFEQLIEQELQ